MLEKLTEASTAFQEALEVVNDHVELLEEGTLEGFKKFVMKVGDSVRTLEERLETMDRTIRELEA